MARKSRKNYDVTASSALANVRTPKIPTAAYVRLSLENSGNETDDTLRTQAIMVESYIKNHPEFQLIGTFIDNGVSGTRFDRPQFIKMMEMARRGEIGCIVVKDLSRFGRDYLETGYYLENIFPLLNIRFIAITDNYDNARPSDRNSLSIPIKNLVNAMYAKDYSKKQEAFRVMCEKAGRVMGIHAAYGYIFDSNQGRLTKDPAVEQYVHLIFSWLRIGLSRQEIADRMNLIDAPTPAAHDNWNFGFTWTAETIRMISYNPVYAGFHVMGRHKVALHRNIAQHDVARSQWIYFPDYHEPYITMDEYEAINKTITRNKKIMDERLAIRKEDRMKIPDSFPGKVFCRECNRRMGFYRGSHHRGYENLSFAYYRCKVLKKDARCSNKKVYLNYIKIIVMDQIRLLLQLAGDMADDILKRQNGVVGSVYTNRKRLVAHYQTKLNALEKKAEKAYIDYLDGVTERAEYDLIKEKTRTDISQVRDKLNHEEEALHEMDMAAQRIATFAEHYADQATGMEFNQQLVDELVEKIAVGDDDSIEIQFTCKDIFTAASVYEEEEY